jgi:paraquat-inducible protein A
MSLATFVLLIPTNLAPLLTVHLLGAQRTTVLGSGVVQLWKSGWVLIALVLGLCGILLPLLRNGGLVIALGALRYSRERPRWLGPLFRWMMRLDAWSMIDVFLLGFFVGYMRVQQNLTVDVGWGAYCLAAAALASMLTRAVLNPRAVWREILPARRIDPRVSAISCTDCDFAVPADAEGRLCPRCGARLSSRKPDAMTRALALTIAGMVLYVPANLYPITVSSHMGASQHYRIIDAVEQLFDSNLWPLGIVIFCTSITIPLVKLAGMAWFILSARRKSSRWLVARTHLHRLIDELGRWSNVDIFGVVIFVPLISFGEMANASPGIGATAFLLVVLVTMLASRAFDPRLMWDAAGRRAQ